MVLRAHLGCWVVVLLVWVVMGARGHALHRGWMVHSWRRRVLAGVLARVHAWRRVLARVLPSTQARELTRVLPRRILDRILAWRWLHHVGRWHLSLVLLHLGR